MDANHCGGVWGGPNVAGAFGSGQHGSVTWSCDEKDQEWSADDKQGGDEYEHVDQTVDAGRVAAYSRVTGLADVYWLRCL